MTDINPSRRDLRQYLFHAARWLIGRDSVCLDPISISIECESQHEVVRLASADREGESFPTKVGLVPTKVGSVPTSQNSQILRNSALSNDERAIVRVIGEQGPIPTKLIFRATGIAKSRGALLVANLRERGIIRPEPDGYVITHPLWNSLAFQQEPNK